MNIKFSQGEKSVFARPEHNIYERALEGKVKFLCPRDGRVDGVRETFENTVGDRAYRVICGKCGWEEMQVPERTVEEPKPTPKVVCSKCGQEFFEGKTMKQEYEKHLREHVLEEAKEGSLQSETVKKKTSQKKRRKKK